MHTQFRKKHEMVYTKAKTARVQVEKKKTIVNFVLQFIFGFSHFSARGATTATEGFEKNL